MPLILIRLKGFSYGMESSTSKKGEEAKSRMLIKEMLMDFSLHTLSLSVLLLLRLLLMRLGWLLLMPCWPPPRRCSGLLVNGYSTRGAYSNRQMGRPSRVSPPRRC